MYKLMVTIIKAKNTAFFQLPKRINKGSKLHIKDNLEMENRILILSYIPNVFEYFFHLSITLFVCLKKCKY
jgi:hypothetical protein